MDLRDRHRILLMFNGDLPPMYRRADYLQAQGDRAVIDTGVPGNNDNLTFEFKFNVDRFIAYRGFFTNYASETANSWRLSEGGSSGFIFNVNTKTGSSTAYSYGSFLNKDTEVRLKRSMLVVRSEGSQYVKQSNIVAGTTNNTTIYINTSRRAAQTRDDVIKWYFFRIYDNDTLIRDYIPCVRLTDSKAGFYDLANNTFNPSIGTQDFTAGYN